MARGPELATAVAAAARAFAEALRRRFRGEVLEVRLFGSYARGDADEDSDVDLAVVLEHADWQRRREVIDLATDVGEERDLRLSPTVFDRDTWERWSSQSRGLVLDILREGVAL